MNNTKVIETDDPAVRINDVWKGNDSFSIPFDARYGAWVAGVGLSLIGVVAAWSVTRAFRTGGTPGAVLMTISVLAACTAAALWLRGRVPGRRWLIPYGLAPLAMQLLAAPATAGGATGALFSLGSAVAFGVGGTVLLIRPIGKHIDRVTPFKYRAATLRAEFNAPRPKPPTAHNVQMPTVMEVVNRRARPVHAPTQVAAPDPASATAHNTTTPLIVTARRALTARLSTPPRNLNT